MAWWGTPPSEIQPHSCLMYSLLPHTRYLEKFNLSRYKPKYRKEPAKKLFRCAMARDRVPPQGCAKMVPVFVAVTFLQVIVGHLVYWYKLEYLADLIQFWIQPKQRAINILKIYMDLFPFSAIWVTSFLSSLLSTTSLWGTLSEAGLLMITWFRKQWTTCQSELPQRRGKFWDGNSRSHKAHWDFAREAALQHLNCCKPRWPIKTS